LKCKDKFGHRARETKLLEDAWKDSDKVYGYRKLHDDLMELGEASCPNRVARLARLGGIRAEIGYKRKSGKCGGKPSVVIGWATQSHQLTDLVLQALLMAVWRRKPKQSVLIHTDQGSQYASRDRAAVLRAHNIEHSMSRRGNGHDNAVAESFVNLLKRERARRRTYKTRLHL
tara:strand:- start:32274 stop:32792 length:519 start_codon:yes stop_codon:yes gene_type:complete